MAQDTEQFVKKVVDTGRATTMTVGRLTIFQGVCVLHTEEDLLYMQRYMEQSKAAEQGWQIVDYDATNPRHNKDSLTAMPKPVTGILTVNAMLQSATDKALAPPIDMEALLSKAGTESAIPNVPNINIPKQGK